LELSIPVKSELVSLLELLKLAEERLEVTEGISTVSSTTVPTVTEKLLPLLVLSLKSSAMLKD
jgi:hypothetical protein